MNTTWVLFGIGLLVWVWWMSTQRKKRSGEQPALPTSNLPPEKLGLLIDPTAEKDRLNPRPRAPEQTEAACWNPPGKAIRVGGYRIERGMCYVGIGLYRDRRAWKPEDFLLDPTLPVSPTQPDTAGRTVSYWPSYHKMTPNARAALLRWLAEGAEAPGTPIGYVLLYLYGIRHRLLNGQPDAAERSLLHDEVERLQGCYGDHALFAQVYQTLSDQTGSSLQTEHGE